MIIYHKGDLFTAPADALLGHACNCKGHWGKGIAMSFKFRFPDAYKAANQDCLKNGRGLLGKARIHDRVVCLYTSRGYGAYVDHPGMILESTEKCVLDLELQGVKEVHIPTINAGLFKVPWTATAEVLERSSITFHVWVQT